MPKLVTKIEKIIDPNEKVQEKLYPIKRFLKQDHNNIPNIKKKYMRLKIISPQSRRFIW